ncbi:hypothetical protein [Rhizobium sp. BE258]|uniref:hypothetical protein n=1 Tax=Rhizobium sp. BE258 TaxID=2817722 RepID=UPI002859F3EC|nr:hypothetical protein [Rhizobium sp. BE258]MDR7148030.1 hypothetical protein [Rhizobium sp. BE258]
MVKSYFVIGCLLVGVVGAGSWGFVSKKQVSALKAEVRKLYSYRYRSQSQIDLARIEIIPENNPYLEKISEIRRVKKSSPSMDAMWSRLQPMAASYHRYGDRRDLAIGAMLVVAGFYDFGNPAPNDEKVGCVSINQETNFTSIGDLSFEAMTKSDIGCCTDFTLMLASFLDHLDFDTEAVITTGHQAVMVTIDGRGHFLDSNNLLFAQDFFGGNDREMHYFTPYAGTRTPSSQHYVMTSMAFSIEGFGRESWKINSLDKHYRLFDAEFLIDETAAADAIPSAAYDLSARRP